MISRYRGPAGCMVRCELQGQLGDLSPTSARKQKVMMSFT
jgi:hypothetical protein